MLRTVLRHAGGLRIDHVMGLFRLWWVPEGRPAAEGTYVRYDHEAMLGILALEAHRAGAVVIGEDLGTVEPWVRDYLTERGVLGTSILWFERDYDGRRALPPERWRELCLATVDHPRPAADRRLPGRRARRIRGRPRAADPAGRGGAAVDEAERESVARAAGRARLARRGRRARRTGVTLALHRFLAGTPSRLLGVALTDVGRRPCGR